MSVAFNNGLIEVTKLMVRYHSWNFALFSNIKNVGPRFVAVHTHEHKPKLAFLQGWGFDGELADVRRIQLSGTLRRGSVEKWRLLLPDSAGFLVTWTQLAPCQDEAYEIRELRLLGETGTRPHGERCSRPIFKRWLGFTGREVKTRAAVSLEINGFYFVQENTLYKA